MALSSLSLDDTVSAAGTTSEAASHTIFNTSAGWVGFSGSSSGLLALTLPQRSPAEVRRRLGGNLEGTAGSPLLFGDLIERLRRYFDGHRVTFPDRLDLSLATAFQREVWQSTRLIPHGETRSYSWVSRQVNRPEAARAVGQALGRNPFPVIVPCHRVVTSDGGPGGFSGGLEMKRYLLSLEGAAMGRGQTV